MSAPGPEAPVDIPPEVSVVVPVHNAGRLLVAQLEALVAQDYPGRWELVVVDNRSDDGSAALAETFADRLRLRVVVADERPGPAYARNVGAAAAQGRLVAFCDADDVVEPQWLRALVSQASTADIVGGAVEARVINAPELARARGFHEVATGLPQGPARFLPYALSGNMIVAQEMLRSLGGFDESLSHCEDVDLCWRAQLQGASIAFQPDAVVHYRFRPSGRDLFRQVRNYSTAETTLYLRYRAHGARRHPWHHAPQRVWWLMTRAPYLVLGTGRRHLWLAVCGEMAGYVRGSWRHRVLYV